MKLLEARRGALGGCGAAILKWLRALSGDDAYERYLTHHARAHEGAPLTRGAFYAEREAAKWSGISRCC
jgi:uncharacterized short protein YbdD (DUF466 family)